MAWRLRRNRYPMRFLAFCVLLGFSLGHALRADTPLSPASEDTIVAQLTLDEAIATALANNFTIVSARYTPQIARGSLLSAAGAFDPTITARATRSDYRLDYYNPLVDLRTYRYQSKTDSLSVALGGKLPFGLEYSVVSESTNDRDTDSDSLLLDSYTTFNGVRLTQPLLRGFGFGANLAGLRLARAQHGIARAQYRQAVIDTITNTITAYNNLYYIQQAYQNTLRSRELANELLNENRRRVEVGSISPADVTIAAARVARIDNSIIQTERDLLDYRNSLYTLLSAETRPATDQPLQIAPPPPVDAPAIDRAADLLRAYELRPDYRQQLEQLKRARAGLSEARSAALPQVDLVGSYGFVGSGNSLDDALRNARSKDTPAWSAGAVVSIPLPLRDGRGRVLTSRATLDQARTQLARLEQQIAIEVANAAGQITTTARRIESARQARQLAGESLVAEQKRLQVGQSDTFTVLQFQELLSAAELAEFRAVADYNIALASYDQTVGTTLERHQVTLEE